MQSQSPARRPALMLASVVSPAEALLAASCGADIIDCKDPRTGALGALPAAEVAEVRRALAAHLPVSATIGDVPVSSQVARERAAVMAAAGADYVKIGLYPGTGSDEVALVRLVAAVGPRARAVAVMLAENGIDDGLVNAVAAAGFAGIMLDTADKSGSSLPDLCTPAELTRFVAAARASGLFCGLAGALRRHHLEPLLALGPDLIGFRGALCARAARTAALDKVACAAIREAIPRASHTLARPQRIPA